MYMEKLEKLAALTTMQKSAAGKMMCVAFKDLVQDSDTKIKTRRGIVYMPDCQQYRDIIENGTRAQKAALCQKFFLNLGKDIHFAECEASISKH